MIGNVPPLVDDSDDDVVGTSDRARPYSFRHSPPAPCIVIHYLSPSIRRIDSNIFTILHNVSSHQPITSAGLKYEIGSALGVFGQNEEAEVDDFLAWWVAMLLLMMRCAACTAACRCNGDDAVAVALWISCAHRLPQCASLHVMRRRYGLDPSGIVTYDVPQEGDHAHGPPHKVVQSIRRLFVQDLDLLGKPGWWHRAIGLPAILDAGSALSGAAVNHTSLSSPHHPQCATPYHFLPLFMCRQGVLRVASKVRHQRQGIRGIGAPWIRRRCGRVQRPGKGRSQLR